MRRARPNDGFALLITITLLAFLVLLLLALAAFTRVETRVAGNQQQLSQARQNALVGLGAALGQLQRLAGPDQRATATADTGFAGGASDGTRHWTGVWGNANPADDYRSEPAFLGWLVSGNESNPFAVDTSAASFGRVTTPATPTYRPADAVTLEGAETHGALATGVKVKGREARVMIGPGSAADSGGYTVAPLVDIEVSADLIPGMSGATDTPVGRYAWWVGDEGVKARLNVVDPWTTTASNARERFQRLLTVQRNGIELVTTDGTATFGLRYNTEGADPARAQFIDRLGNTLSLGQAGLLPGFDDEVGRTALRRRYHDLTAVSRGVLADQLRGGLRKDLTVLFETAPSAWTGSLKTSLDGVSATYAGARRIADFQDGRLYGAGYSMNASVAADARSPVAATWEQVRSFYHYASSNNGTVGAVSRTDDRMGVFPLVSRWGLSFDLEAAAGAGGTLHLFPHVVLWNPYNVTVEGSYRVRVEFAADSQDNTTAKRIYFVTPRREADGTPIDELPYEVYHNELIVPSARAGTGKYSDRTLEFTLESVAIPPGMAVVFSAKATRPYDETEPALNLMAPGYRTDVSFTRPVPHSFTSRQVEDSALVLANIDGGNGGTVSFHLLDSSGDALQLIDAPGLRNDYVHVSRNNGVLPIEVTMARDGGFVGFRDLSASSPGADSQVGFAFLNSLQASDSRYNWLAQINQRAASIGKAWFEWGAGFAGTANWMMAGPRADRWNIEVDTGDSTRTYIGPNHGPAFSTANSPSLVKQAVLFHLPRAETPVLSLGQLQHAALSSTPSGHEPTYALGNAYPTPHIRQDRLLRPNELSGSIPSASEAHLTDVSYLLNRALWDRFYFSGTPDLPADVLQARIDAGDAPPGGRLRYLAMPDAGAVRDFDRAAAHLAVDGAFNVNSASVEAWTALLAGLRGVNVNPASGATATGMNGTPYVRTPHAPAGSGPSTAADNWAGYRLLTDAQVRPLAVALRDEVRARGPFLSLADFVNRSLVAYSDDPFNPGLGGTLQSALDRVSRSGASNSSLRVNWTYLERDRPTTSSVQLPTEVAETWEQGDTSRTYYRENIRAPRRGTTNTGRAKGAMAPGFLSQADMLSALGPALAARSDTFTIRAYGEMVNPMLAPNDPGYIVGRSWCEAVVQRLPEYVDLTNAPEVPPVTGTTVNLTSENQLFGRRFAVTFFRWLSPADL